MLFVGAKNLRFVTEEQHNVYWLATRRLVKFVSMMFQSRVRLIIQPRKQRGVRSLSTGRRNLEGWPKFRLTGSPGTRVTIERL